ncbi:MAG: 4-alpha-glucanotransferase [Lachnospiraceae bacterium]
MKIQSTEQLHIFKRRISMSKLEPRYAGILLHVSSLPSPYGIGDFGRDAYEFVDFLEKAGQTLWQVLPLGPTGYGDSPYQSFSAFAGQPLFISLDDLVKDRLLSPADLKDVPHFSPDSVDYGWVLKFKTPLYHKAYDTFKKEQSNPNTNLPLFLFTAFDRFCKEQADWLDDYALFMSVKDSQNGICFLDWPSELRHPTPEKKAELMREFVSEIQYYQFIQFLVHRQWIALKTYANEKKISIVGDIPIFVSMDSADVWAHPELFQLDEDGYPTVVAGVPPDYFSKTGQLWGNPLYDWDYQKTTGYDWWMKRIKKQLTMFDYIRIDHFRGFEAYWAVPYKSKTAIKGKWRPGPDHDFFTALTQQLGEELPIWAEDLGIITSKVEQLRDDFNLPGMKVLQFAFSNLKDNKILPQRFTTTNCICYTGTHDNNTTRGWYDSLSEEYKNRIRIHMNSDGSNIAWDMIRTALSTTAKYALYPMQDLLGYGSDCRMNTPSLSSGNWQFRVRKENFNDGLAGYLRMLTGLFGRLPQTADEDDEDDEENKMENTLDLEDEDLSIEN